MLDEKTVSLLKWKVNKDTFLDLPAEGFSMFPLIRKGDLCRFIKAMPETLVKGDIVLFHTNEGQLVAHRFYHRIMEAGITFYYLKGDTNLCFDQAIHKEQILGKLSYIQRKSNKEYVKNFSINLWSFLILNFPILSRYLRKYINRKYLYQ